MIHYRYSHPWGMINGPAWTNGFCKVKTKLCWKKELLNIACPAPVCFKDVLCFELETKSCAKLKLNNSCLPFFIHTNENKIQSDKHVEVDPEKKNCYEKLNCDGIDKEENPKYVLEQEEEPYVYPIKYWQHHPKRYSLADIPEQESEPEEESIIEIIAEEPQEDSDNENLTDENVFVGYKRTEL